MWGQKGLGSFKAGLDAYWKPYLDGKSTLDAALLGLLKSQDDQRPDDEDRGER